MPGKAKVLTPQEVRQVVSVLKNSRDKTLFLTGLYTGLRISELIALEQGQLFSQSGAALESLRLIRPKIKQTIHCDIPVHPELRGQLVAYKSAFLDGLVSNKDASRWLFPTMDVPGKHIGRTQAHNILTKAFKEIDLAGATTHSMRRTCLTLMARAGVPLRTIQEVSGHSNLSQLQSYLELDPADRHWAILTLKY
ncbi:MAG: site-specific integrase [Cyanobacteria bacterium SZAS LIN-3]|nr:site-specific integrase [Cyanobacteria bacterium SZAS LIN-3]